MSKSSVRKKPTDRALCLICGFVGQPKFFISCLNSTMAATETPLLRLLTSVIGEEPCFSMGHNICEQCFMFFNRLDTYQARANELFSHLRARYKDTKLQYVGTRQKLSDQIYSSLSNIKKVKNGTSLNVCNELTVTVYHSGQPPSKSRAENLLSKKAKQTETPLSNGILSQKRKLPCTSRNPVKKLKTEAPPKKETKDVAVCSSTANVSGIKTNRVQPVPNISPTTPRKINSADLFDVEAKSEHQKDHSAGDDTSRSTSGSSSRQSSHSSSSGCESESTKKTGTTSGRSSSASNTSKSSNSSSSSNSTSSSSSEDDSSSSDDDEQANKVTGDEAKQDNDEEVHSTVNGTSEQSSAASPEDAGQAEDVNSELAEAVLMQNSYANSLLQRFMSTSLWMGGTDGPSCRDGDHQQDISAEALQSAVEAQHCKQKRLELKNTGQSYINTKGKLIDAKRISAQDCSRCPLKCSSRLDEPERRRIFADYWGLGDYDLQREYLANHMKREEKVGPSGCSRTVVLYFLSHGGAKVQVCRQFFLKTLDVSEKASRIVLAKKRLVP